MLAADVKTTPHDETSGSNSTPLHTIHLRSSTAILVLLPTSSGSATHILWFCYSHPQSISSNLVRYLPTTDFISVSCHRKGRAGTRSFRLCAQQWRGAMVKGTGSWSKFPGLGSHCVSHTNLRCEYWQLPDFIFVQHCFFVKWKCRHCEAEQMKRPKMLRTALGMW